MNPILVDMGFFKIKQRKNKGKVEKKNCTSLLSYMSQFQKLLKFDVTQKFWM